MAKRQRKPILAALAGIVLLGLAACSGVGDTASVGDGSDITLVMENSPSGPLTRNFTPFSTTSAANALGSLTMIYEPLLQFNLLRAGQTYPWLAESYDWSNGGRTLTLKLRNGVKWTDGQDFTSADVAFTFGLVQRNTALNRNGLDISGVSAPDAHTAVLNFGRVSFVDLYYIGSQVIVPEHIWSKVGDPVTYVDANPVGTGPYVLETFSPQGYTLVRNTKFWQPGKPKIGKLNFPAFDSNTSANLALANGSLDWAGNFVSNIQQTYVARDPNTHKYWSPAANVVSLIPNLTVEPLNDLAVRRAISAALDRSQISKDGEQGTEPPATSAGGLVLPLYDSYLDPSVANNLVQDKASVRSILTSNGYSDRNGHWVGRNGKPIAFTVEVPSSYSDYVTDAQVIAEQLNSQGFQVTVKTLTVNEWSSDLPNGTFQSTIYWSSSGPSPYYMYDNWLDSGLTKPIGQAATGDIERFQNPQAQDLLRQFANSTDGDAQRQAIQGLERITAEQLPVIPLMYGVDWGEYNTSKVTGWPTESNPYQQPQPSPPYNEYTVLQLRPA